MERYIVSGRLGEGAHGIVLKAIDKVTMTVVAIKRLSLKSMSDQQGLPNSAIRELLALRLVQHEYVANLIDYFPQGLSLILVCEYFPTDLYEYLRSHPKPLPVGHAKAYLWMLAKAIDYIHSLGIMHRDLKPANLLIAPTGELKVTDFGLCRLFGAENHSNDDQQKKNKIQYTHQVASRWYRAPELLYGSRDYGPEIDLWAMGCIFGELLKNSPLFPGENDIGQLCTVVQVLGTPTEENWPGVSLLPDYHKISFTETRRLSFREIMPGVDEASVSFLERFLRYFPSTRITASQILEDDYFSCHPPATALSEMPKPAQKSLASSTAEFSNWDWSAKDFS